MGEENEVTAKVKNLGKNLLIRETVVKALDKQLRSFWEEKKISAENENILIAKQENIALPLSLVYQKRSAKVFKHLSRYIQDLGMQFTLNPISMKEVLRKWQCCNNVYPAETQKDHKSGFCELTRRCFRCCYDSGPIYTARICREKEYVHTNKGFRRKVHQNHHRKWIENLGRSEIWSTKMKQRGLQWILFLPNPFSKFISDDTCRILKVTRNELQANICSVSLTMNY